MEAASNTVNDNDDNNNNNSNHNHHNHNHHHHVDNGGRTNNNNIIRTMDVEVVRRLPEWNDLPRPRNNEPRQPQPQRQDEDELQAVVVKSPLPLQNATTTTATGIPLPPMVEVVISEEEEEEEAGVTQPQPKQKQQKPRMGVMVLGMHRSGTSMLTGLLATVAGYTVGGPLLAKHVVDNPKGYFERVDIMTQNDAWMSHQNNNKSNKNKNKMNRMMITWDQNVQRYNARRAVLFSNTTANRLARWYYTQHNQKAKAAAKRQQRQQQRKRQNNNNNNNNTDTIATNDTNHHHHHYYYYNTNNNTTTTTTTTINTNNDNRTFLERVVGGLEFLNNPNNAPWIQKDPRNCITLPTWLALMNNEPAILFTYRHPLEVSLSLMKREGGNHSTTATTTNTTNTTTTTTTTTTSTNTNWTLTRGLELWILYNQKALQHSQGLCRITSSNEALLQNPAYEVQRISHQLTTRCGLPAPPHPIIDIMAANQFVNVELQRHRRSRRQRQRQHQHSQPPHEEETDDANTGIWRTTTTYNKKNDTTHNKNGTCVVQKLHSTLAVGTLEQKHEEQMYRVAMKVFCDLESGMAYEDTYVWPTTTTTTTTTTIAV
jgi:hypothetical protein